MDETLRVKTLVAVASMDAYQARLTSIRESPTIVGRMDSERAAKVLAGLEAEGVPAIAPTRDEIWNLRTTPRMRSLIPADAADAYAIHFWDGRVTELKVKDIVLLVRGRVQRSSSRTDSSSGNAGAMAAGYLVGGVLGAAMAAEGGGTVRSSRIELSHLLDVFVRNGTRVRISGDKFSFDVLGAEKGYSDHENMDKLSLRLANDAPRALVDMSFQKFKPPAEILRDSFQSVGTSGVSRRDDFPAFDFYSAWIYLVNRRLGLLG